MKQEQLSEQVADLLMQSLAHERGGVQVYETAIQCAINDDLKEEWQKYLEETRHHVEVLTDICTKLGLDPEEETPGVEVITHLGQALVEAMEMAQDGGKPEAAQIVACECVVLAETKDHLDWELIGKCGEKLLKGDAAKMLTQAYEEIEDQEDEHLYHTKGWCRELWIESLGMKAMLPPPEEERQVKTAVGAARAEQEANSKR
jgi:rubrerythrin